MTDPLRLALGTLTAVPVPAPRRVDREVAGRAMALAPLVGALLAVAVAGPLALATALDVPAGSLLLAALAVSALALLTRGMHLDGLADTADGLGCGRPGERALEVMRRSDVGPFGVATLLLVLTVQVAALAECLAHGYGASALAASLVTGRAALALVCTPRFPAARADGLGATVAGSVRAGGLLVVALLVAAVVAPLAVVGPAAPPLVALLGVVPAVGLALHAARRFGGVTGDVYGAVVEVATTGALVAAALAG